jgi:heme exporter protein B
MSPPTDLGHAAPTGLKNTVRIALLILKKDLAVELRTREVLMTMTLFATLIVVIFAFAFQLDVDGTRAVAPGLIWVVVVFSGNLGITRVMDKERENGALSGLLLSPGGPTAVFWGKALGVFIFMLVMELITIPLALLFIGIDLPVHAIGDVALALLLGSFGFALIGTLFGAMLGEARLREVLIPLVVYPIIVPVLVSGVKLTALALAPSMDDETNYLALMLGFDLLYLGLCPWVFSRVLTP